MKLLLTSCLTWALLHTAESLRCHTCSDAACTNSTSVQCPAASVVCRTVTSVTGDGVTTRVKVNKTCATLRTCVTPLALETEWAVNRGFAREAHTQLCCLTDNCNFQTLATPSSAENGKLCPACASSAQSLTGTCNASLACMGAEDSCFSGEPSSSGDALQRGCISRNLCILQATLTAVFGENSAVTCGAPWGVGVGAALPAALPAALLAAYKVLV